MSKTELVVCHAALSAQCRRLQDLQQEDRKNLANLAKVERAASQVLKCEEDARASFARRIQSKTEAEDRLARMQKNEPGISFMGYESPARRRLGEMQQAIAEHGRAAKVARERQTLAIEAAKTARQQLAIARERYHRWQCEQPELADPRQCELQISGLRGRIGFLLERISEADVDEAIMLNQISRDEAYTIRRALRSRVPNEMER